MRRLIRSVAGLIVATGLPYVVYLVLYYLRDPTGSPADKESWEPTISVVLPTYNEERIVENKLADLLALDYPMEKIELVVVDSSEDKTPAIVEEFFADREHPTLNLIQEDERHGLAPALNDAYAAAMNEIVVKTDCDSKLASDALREATANLADAEIGAVTGRNAEVLGESDVEAEYRGIQAKIQMLESHLNSTLIFHGPFSAFKREEIVPIDPSSMADDTELALLIRRNGKRVIFDPAIRYREASHSGFRKRRKQKDRRGMGLIRLLVQHRDALGWYENYGRVVLPFNWWFMIVSPVLVAIDIVLVSVLGVLTLGTGGLFVPMTLAGFVWLGQSDRLGPVQPIYSIFDTQISLLRASVELLRGEVDGTWDVDMELRDAFE